MQTNKKNFITPKDLYEKFLESKFSNKDMELLENLLLEKISGNISFSIHMNEWSKKSSAHLSKVYVFLQEQGYEVRLEPHCIRIDMSNIQNRQENNKFTTSNLTPGGTPFPSPRTQQVGNCHCDFDEGGRTSTEYCSVCDAQIQ